MHGKLAARSPAGAPRWAAGHARPGSMRTNSTSLGTARLAGAQAGRLIFTVNALPVVRPMNCALAPARR